MRQKGKMSYETDGDIEQHDMLIMKLMDETIVSSMFCGQYRRNVPYINVCNMQTYMQTKNIML